MAKNSKNRRNKVSLVFDEDKRREFLTGFHKRKLQRKKEAKERLERDLKSERKRLKVEAKESYKKLVVSHRSIPELENFLLKDEYEEDEVTVTIRELSTNQIALDNNLIGANRPIKTEESVCTAATPEADHVPGMSPQRNKPESSSNLPRTFKDAREIKKLLKKEATKKVKKSKVFNKISQIERSKQRKRSQYQEKVKLKMRKKH